MFTLSFFLIHKPMPDAQRANGDHRHLFRNDIRGSSSSFSVAASYDGIPYTASRAKRRLSLSWLAKTIITNQTEATCSFNPVHVRSLENIFLAASIVCVRQIGYYRISQDIRASKSPICSYLQNHYRGNSFEQVCTDGENP